MVGCSGETVWLSSYLPLAWAGHCCLGLAMGVLGPTQPFLATQVNNLERKTMPQTGTQIYFCFEGWSPEHTNQLHLDTGSVAQVRKKLQTLMLQEHPVLGQRQLSLKMYPIKKKVSPVMN